MKDCERMELLVSALLDGEGEPGEQREALDHLIDCADCRRFYQEASALQGRLDLLPPGAWPAAPRRAWPRLGGGRTWLQAAALGAMLALGLALGAHLGPRAAGLPALPAEGETIDLALASDGGAMDDREFVGLTLRLLRADRRYHRELAAILDRVAPARAAGEASAGEIALATEQSPGDVPERAARVIY